jgi:capsule biosynthesis phosphatase
MKDNLKLIIDIDGTLCPIKEKDQDYSDLIPDIEILEKIREYKRHGAYIIFYTSRNMKTYNSNLGLINIKTAPVILDWFKKWDIPYDELLLGKPWPSENGFYIDDRSIRPKEFLKYTQEEIDEIIKSDRI